MEAVKETDGEKKKKKRVWASRAGDLWLSAAPPMALQGGMKSLLIVPSGNWSSQLLSVMDLFTFQRLDPTQELKKKKKKEMMQGIQGINILER